MSKVVWLAINVNFMEVIPISLVPRNGDSIRSVRIEIVTVSINILPACYSHTIFTKVTVFIVRKISYLDKLFSYPMP